MPAGLVIIIRLFEAFAGLGLVILSLLGMTTHKGLNNATVEYPNWLLWSGLALGLWLIGDGLGLVIGPVDFFTLISNPTVCAPSG